MNRPISPTMRRWIPRTVVILLCLGASVAVLVTALYQVEKWRGQRAWRAYEREARARAVKLTLEEYVPPPVADAENYAAMPIFQDFARAVALDEHAETPLALPKDEEGKRPPFSDRRRGQRIDLAVWQKFFVETKLLAAAGTDPATDVLTALRTYDPLLAQLREASARPRTRFPIKWDDALAARFPHVGVLKAAAKLYVLRMAAHLAEGHRAAALEEFHAGLRLYTALRHEPGMISGLVRVVILKAIENAVWDGLAGGQWSEVELREIEGALASLRLMADYRFAMGGERGFTNQVYNQLTAQGTPATRNVYALIAGMSSGGKPTPWYVHGFIECYPTGWHYHGMVRLNRIHDEVLARMSEEPPRFFMERPISSMPIASEVSSYEKLYYFMFFTMVPAVTTLEETYARAQTSTDQTRLACALERHRLARGSYPEALDALSPEFIPALPRDVMTGEPLHYRLLDGGRHFILYSVGSDGADDRGETEGEKPDDAPPDWVWRSAASVADAEKDGLPSPKDRRAGE